jgi:ribonuclease J
MRKNVELAERLGLLSFPKDLVVDIEDVDQLDDGEVCVLSTGSQGEPLSALALLATGENKWLSLREGDTVVISAHPIPGNEWAVGRVVDGLHRRGAEVVHTGVEPVHVSGHARQGELKTFLSVASPEWFVPVHGEYRHLVNHAVLAEAMGVETHKVLVCEDGDVLSLEDDGLALTGEVPAGYLYVDGTVGDVGHGVLRDRRVLSEEGVVVVVCTVDLHARDLVADPEIVTRGWVHAPEAEELIEEASAAVRSALESALADGAPDHEALSRHARKALGKFVGERTRRRPMIVPVVVCI